MSRFRKAPGVRIQTLNCWVGGERGLGSGRQTQRGRERSMRNLRWAGILNALAGSKTGQREGLLSKHLEACHLC